MRCIGGAALLVLGAAVLPPPGQLADSLGAWFVATVAAACFIVAYKLLAPPGASALGPSAEKDEAQ
jgi:hypothetical protein